jgi:hypothetical protein
LLTPHSLQYVHNHQAWFLPEPFHTTASFCWLAFLDVSTCRSMLRQSRVNHDRVNDLSFVGFVNIAQDLCDIIRAFLFQRFQLTNKNAFFIELFPSCAMISTWSQCNIDFSDNAEKEMKIAM